MLIKFDTLLELPREMDQSSLFLNYFYFALKNIISHVLTIYQQRVHLLFSDYPVKLSSHAPIRSQWLVSTGPAERQVNL